MSPKQKKLKWWQILGTGVASGLVLLGGGSGIAATIDAVQGPDLAPQRCNEYWAEIHQLKVDGFTGFSLMDDDSELADRCGSPQDVADAWLDEPASP